MLRLQLKRAKILWFNKQKNNTLKELEHVNIGTS